MPAVSFVIVNWNGRHLLQDCLSSIRSQTYREWEILVVDNGSTDGSREFLAGNFPEATVIPLETNQGFAEPNNIAFRKSDARFIATINNDLTLDPAWLASLVDAMERRPDCFAVQGKILKSDQREIVDTCGLGMRPCGAARNLAHNRPESEIREERPIFAVSAGAALYRRETLVQLGLFESRYFAYYEDLDLGWRARLKGLQSWLIPKAIAYHKVHGTSGGVPGDFLWFLSERNRLRTVVRNMPFSALLGNPGRFLIDEMRYLDMIRKKAGWKTLAKARLTFLTELPSFWRTRPPETKQRGSSDWDEWLRLSE